MIFTNVRQIKNIEDARTMRDQLLKDPDQNLNRIERWGLDLWSQRSATWIKTEEEQLAMASLAVGASFLILAVRESRAVAQATLVCYDGFTNDEGTPP